MKCKTCVWQSCCNGNMKNQCKKNGYNKYMENTGKGVSDSTQEEADNDRASKNKTRVNTKGKEKV